MKKTLLLLFYIQFSFVFFSGKALADGPVVRVSAKPGWILPCKPYDKKPSARDINNGAYAELIEEQVNVEAKATYNHVITQIVSESGVQNNSEISVSFDPSYEQLYFHEIIVWRDNRPQSRLNSSAFKMLADESEFNEFIYNGTYTANYILADIRKGDRIEYSYTVTGANPIFGNKFCRSIYLQGADLIAHQYTTLIYPVNRTLNMRAFNLLSQPKVSTARGLRRYEWEDFQVPGVPANKFAPKWFNQFARVQVSEFNNWADVVAWGLKINPVQTDFTGGLADTVAKLKKLYANDREKYFRASVTLVQNGIRYMGIETGEYSHKANLPEKVYEQRYGDCKDKSLLLASILNYGGIEAHMALLNSDLEDKIENFIPSAILFNHAVVVATINGKQVWVDATMANQGGKGMDIYFPPYGEALILKAGNSGLAKIRETKTGKIVCVERFDIKDEYSPVKFNVTTTYTLDEADDTRDHIASTGLAKIEKGYLDYYSKTFTKIEAADSLIVKDNQAKNKLTTIERYTIHDFFKHDTVARKYSADFYASDIADQLPGINGQINTPVSVSYPYTVDYTTDIYMSDGSGWDIADDHYAINRSTYKFQKDKTVKDDKLSLHYQFAYLQDYVPQDKIAEFKQDIKDLKDDKLSFNFFYTPDINKVPFKINQLMLVITVLVLFVCGYWGLKIYKTETKEGVYYDRNYYAPPLGGWLIVLIIVIVLTALRNVKYLADEGYYSVSKWDLFTIGISSLVNRILLIFETMGYVALTCFAAFCLVLIFKKRDIAPRLIKGYYLFMVIFLFVDYFFNSYVNGKFSNYDVEQIIQAVVVAAIWTYYLNVSTRVRETFVVPYPN